MRLETSLEGVEPRVHTHHPRASTTGEVVPLEWFAALWRHQGALLALLDAIVVAGCFMLAYLIRFHAQFLAIKRVPVAAAGLYLKGAVLLAAAWVFFIWREGGYESGLRGAGTFLIRLRTVLRSGVYALALLMAVSFMYRGLLLSRQVYLMTGVLACGTMLLTRLFFRAVERDLAAQGAAVQRVVLVGTDRHAQQVLRQLTGDGGAIRVVGLLRWNGEADGAVSLPRESDPTNASDLPGVPLLGDLSAVPRLRARLPFDTLIMIFPEGCETPPAQERVLEVLNFCEAEGIDLYMVPTAFDVAVSRREVGSFCDRPLIRLRDASVRPTYAVVKRAMDLVLATTALVLGMPLWLLIALLVKVTSPGPIFFTQVRAGLHGRLFRLYKFRSMVADAEKRLSHLVDVEKLEVPGFKIKNDPRVTPLGRFLRRTGLDEIPQLINVIKGEMSLVGPRPELPELVARYSPEHRRRLKAKPGITGYQQIMARGIPLAAGVKYDLKYLKHQSILFDLYILLKTVEVVIRGRGVSY